MKITIAILFYLNSALASQAVVNAFRKSEGVPFQHFKEITIHRPQGGDGLKILNAYTDQTSDSATERSEYFFYFQENGKIIPQWKQVSTPYCWDEFAQVDIDGDGTLDLWSEGACLEAGGRMQLLLKKKNAYDKIANTDPSMVTISKLNGKIRLIVVEGEDNLAWDQQLPPLLKEKTIKDLEKLEKDTRLVLIDNHALTHSFKTNPAALSHILYPVSIVSWNKNKFEDCSSDYKDHFTRRLALLKQIEEDISSASNKELKNTFLKQIKITRKSLESKLKTASARPIVLPKDHSGESP